MEPLLNELAELTVVELLVELVLEAELPVPELLDEDEFSLLFKFRYSCLKRSKKFCIPLPPVLCFELIELSLLLMHVSFTFVKPSAQAHPFYASTKFNFGEHVLQLSPPLL